MVLKNANILVLDDDMDVLTAVRLLLKMEARNVTTEKNPDIATVIERYAARWSIEVAIEDAKQLFGTGQAYEALAGKFDT